jgi:hypothetical protein
VLTNDETAVAIPLKMWQDPQGNPLLIFSEHLCLVYVGCWEEAGIAANYVGQLRFEAGWAARGYGIEYLPYRIEQPQRSAIYEVLDSSWLADASEQRSRHYPEWKKWDERVYHHYAVQGHDRYVEIIAEAFAEERIPRESAKDVLPLLYPEYNN